ncbi:hypothetical protein [Tenacibaculum insulae]|uniref:hypothetical protein n=1 Tax=Tenacibaculum insulae TaxID=2029677 RepID=UPI003AB2FE08
MDLLNKILTEIPEIKDQEKLLEETLKENDFLSKQHIKIVAWASSIVTKDTEIVSYIKEKVGELNKEEKRTVFIASSRMSVTNPYFMGRNVHPVNAGGTIDSLGFQPFQSLKITDELAYHYACIAFSIINGGYMCFNSHMTSLKNLGQDPKAIDQALRLSVAISAIRQGIFNSTFL